jgi:hypothetical protein
MTNVFQCNYDVRLKSWYDLRQSLKDADLKTQCIEVDKWWQYAPLVNHYLLHHLPDTWPNPWELLAENYYCEVARGLGMIYTILLLGTTDIDFVVAKNYNNEEITLVLVDRAKYILNYWPDTVVNNCLQDFTITKSLDVIQLIKKIG